MFLASRRCGCLLRRYPAANFATARGAASPAEDDAHTAAQRGALHELAVARRELPVVDAATATAQAGAPGSAADPEVQERKAGALRAALESAFGADRMRVVRILQDHQVVVRGGPDEASKLLDALLAWKAEGVPTGKAAEPTYPSFMPPPPP